ncbi:IS3 family transposase [Nocardioides sp.]|uniref:IS3 family transposase n=1 Tax=Nocardioides sp. TaxID=35761 RepID=UPI0037843871
MPKRVDPAVKERALRMMAEHRSDYPSDTALAEAVAKKVGVGRETARRWLVQADVNAGARPGVTTDDQTEIKKLKAENRRLKEDIEILKSATGFLRRGARPPQPLIMAFIDDMKAAGHAVESTCRVLTEHGCGVAARTYRSWKQITRPIAARTVSDAVIIDALISVQGTPEGLYGRRKMTRWLRRQGHQVAFCTTDRLMGDLGMNGVRRGKGIRTTVPAKDGNRAGDLLDRDFTAPAPNQRWVADFTYCRTWAGFVYVAFIVDVYAQRIVGWQAASTKVTDLVLTPLRIALWDRERQGTPVGPGQLLHHSDAGSQYTSIRFTEHLELEGIAPSIGSVGDAYDNALMESIIGLFKTEAITTTVFHDGPYKTLADVEYAAAGWVDWYNHRRLHGSLNWLTPVEYEQDYYAALNRESLPV